MSDPVASQVVNDIDESSRYSITKHSLIPGKTYKVIIIPVNELGEGGPSWFSDFNPIGLIHDENFPTPLDYQERSCHAVPTCKSESVQCGELDADDFNIVARSVPPLVSNKNRFSKDSILLTFESPLIDDRNGKSSGMPTDKFLISAIYGRHRGYTMVIRSHSTIL